MKQTYHFWIPLLLETAIQENSHRPREHVLQPRTHGRVELSIFWKVIPNQSAFAFSSSESCEDSDDDIALLQSPEGTLLRCEKRSLVANNRTRGKNWEEWEYNSFTTTETILRWLMIWVLSG